MICLFLLNGLLALACFCANPSNKDDSRCSCTNCCKDGWYITRQGVKTTDPARCSACPADSVMVDTYGGGKGCCIGNKMWYSPSQEWSEESYECNCVGGRKFFVSGSYYALCDGNSIAREDDHTSIRSIQVDGVSQKLEGDSMFQFQNDCETVGGKICSGSCKAYTKDQNTFCATYSGSTCKHYDSDYGDYAGCAYVH